MARAKQPAKPTRKKTHGHGGARSGAGRPRLSKLGIVTVLTVSLTPEQLAAAEAVGGGNPRKGIKKLLDGVKSPGK